MPCACPLATGWCWAPLRGSPTSDRPWNTWTGLWTGQRSAACSWCLTCTAARVARAARHRVAGVSGLAAHGTPVTGDSGSPWRCCRWWRRATSRATVSPASKCATSPPTPCLCQGSAVTTTRPSTGSGRRACQQAVWQSCCPSSSGRRLRWPPSGGNSLATGTRTFVLTFTATTALRTSSMARPSRSTCGPSGRTQRCFANTLWSLASGASRLGTPLGPPAAACGKRRSTSCLG
mmetsp:Transcript_109732/g.328000  ORF Transcript_109732/g.328000 Transcript_109732/m.328000 type:complete len:234 (-) Transcript_109732:1004-1705(-)